MCRTSGQNDNECDDFISESENTLNDLLQLNSSFITVLVDFNARSPSWWSETITPEVSRSYSLTTAYTAQKMKFAVKDFVSKCDQIRGKLRIWSHLLKKSLMENFIFCAVI